MGMVRPRRETNKPCSILSLQEFSRWFNHDCKLVTLRSFFSIYAGPRERITQEQLQEMLVDMGGDGSQEEVTLPPRCIFPYQWPLRHNTKV